jgi:queuine/archaeosine tRNA-ribosyltransferase
LFISNEVLAARLLTLHNLALYQGLMATLRDAIVAGPAHLDALAAEVSGWHRPLHAGGGSGNSGRGP